MGNYMAPPAPEHERRKERAWQTFDDLLADVERL